MTKADIIRMAIEAELICNEEGRCGWVEDTDLLPFIERFAELVRADAIADEREACAKVCEEFSMTLANMSQAWRNGCRESATEIRERRKS